jgi:hypothetical protein
MRGTHGCLALTLSLLVASCATPGSGSNDSSTAPPATASAKQCEASTASRIRRCDRAGVRTTTAEGLEDAGLIKSRSASGSPPTR